VQITYVFSQTRSDYQKRENVFSCISLNIYRHRRRRRRRRRRRHHHHHHHHHHHGLCRKKLLISVPINPKIFLVFEEYHSYRLHTKFYPISFSQS
jgi:hypothetical protein